MLSLDSLDVPGILARNTDDIALYFNALTGQDQMDSTTLDQVSDHSQTNLRFLRHLLLSIGLDVTMTDNKLILLFFPSFFKDKIKNVSIGEDPDLSQIRVGIPAEYYCEDMSDEVVEAWSQVSFHFFSFYTSSVKTKPRLYSSNSTPLKVMFTVICNRLLLIAMRCLC